MPALLLLHLLHQQEREGRQGWNRQTNKQTYIIIDKQRRQPYLKLLPEPGFAIHILGLFLQLGVALLDAAGEEGGCMEGKLEVDDPPCGLHERCFLVVLYQFCQCTELGTTPYIKLAIPSLDNDMRHFSIHLSRQHKVPWAVCGSSDEETAWTSLVRQKSLSFSAVDGPMVPPKGEKDKWRRSYLIDYRGLPPFWGNLFTIERLLQLDDHTVLLPQLSRILYVILH